MKHITVIISVLLILSLSLNIWQHNNKRIEYKEIEVVKRDTILNFIHSTDTVYNTRTKTEYKYITVNDTIYIENKSETFKDTTDTYDIEINSVKMNWYKLNIHKADTITYEKEIIKNVYKPKKQRFNHGIQVGIGYGIWNRKPDLYIGYGIQYNF